MGERKVQRTERGYAGHFCAAMSCSFRRNTLLTCGNRRIVVSTVGNYRPRSVENGAAETIGVNRYYETMAFHAQWEEPYWEADVGREIGFESQWGIFDGVEHDSDAKADAMHETVVAELSRKLQQRGSKL